MVSGIHQSKIAGGYIIVRFREMMHLSERSITSYMVTLHIVKQKMSALGNTGKTDRHDPFRSM
jgi:hypothetical protein